MAAAVVVVGVGVALALWARPTAAPRALEGVASTAVVSASPPARPLPAASAAPVAAPLPAPSPSPPPTATPAPPPPTAAPAASSATPRPPTPAPAASPPPPAPAAPSAAPGEVTVLFGYASTVPLLTSSDELRAVVDRLRACPGRIVLTGHTCDIGPEATNRALGHTRADALRGILVTAGLDERRLVVRSAGKSTPTAEVADEPSRARNRRVTAACE